MGIRPVELLERYSVTVKEASAITGISADVLRAHIKKGNLPAARPSTAMVIVLEDLKAFVEEMKSNLPDA